MATYKGIQGYSVQSLSSDPGTLSEVVGQLWYNSDAGKFKISVQAAGAWASATSLNGDKQSPGSAGTTTAAVVFGGLDTVPPYAATTNTEQYNGSTWTEVADLGTARYVAGQAGSSSTAALFFGGIGGTGAGATPPYAVTESWNGSAWTEVGDLATARFGLAGFGTQTAAVAAGGTPPNMTNVEEWDGTSWSEGTDLSVARKNFGGFGTLTSGAVMGGRRASPEAAWINTLEYDGTTWTEGGDLNTGSFAFGAAGTTQTAGLIFARSTVGPPGVVVSPKTEEYDGSTWTEVADMATTRQLASQNIGTSTAALGAGGESPVTASTAAVEEWSGAPVSAKTVTVS